MLLRLLVFVNLLLPDELKYNNFETNFRFNETNGKVGSSNYFENEINYNLDKNNTLAFKTRRNRKISLTEFYDLIYEYQNDCLTAAVKYRKTYYQDRDAIPKEDLFFSITFSSCHFEQKMVRNYIEMIIMALLEIK